MPNIPEQTQNNDAIIKAWRRLPDIVALSFVATPGADSCTGWAGRGTATVICGDDGDDMCFRENGEFTPAGSDQTLTFHNVYRWQLRNDALCLSHERFGRDRPVRLFDLVADGNGGLHSEYAHVCGQDRYQAQLKFTAAGFILRWRIRGPVKDETLVYRYSAD